MDRETEQQLDEYTVERELDELRSVIVSVYVDMLDPCCRDCGYLDWLKYEATVLRKRERLLKRLACLPLPEDDWSDSCEHWAIDCALDEAEARDAAAEEEACLLGLCLHGLAFE
jgi:hypothetical protein